jgi:Ca-activated chloride channel family protein
MEFTWPWLLPLLLAVPLLVAAYIWAMRRRVRYALRYSSLTIVKDALGKGPGIRRHIPPAFFLVGITAMLIGLARPVGLVTVPAVNATVILTIDVSRSMRARDIEPSRIDAAIAAAEEFISQQTPTTRIGVVSFSASADVVQAPTTDQEAVLAAVDRLQLGSRTAIGSGILTSLDAIFERSDASGSAPASVDPTVPTLTPTPVPDGYHQPAIVILLSDGRSNTGPLPLESAQIAANRGVRIFTVGLGTTQGGAVQGGPGGNDPFGGGQFGGGFRGGGGGGFNSQLDEPTLQEIATITGGKYFHATETEQLLSIYKNLNTELIVQTERTELTAWFTGFAGICMLLGGLLSLLWFNRLP